MHFGLFDESLLEIMHFWFALFDESLLEIMHFFFAHKLTCQQLTFYSLFFNEVYSKDGRIEKILLVSFILDFDKIQV